MVAVIQLLVSVFAYEGTLVRVVRMWARGLSVSSIAPGMACVAGVGMAGAHAMMGGRALGVSGVCASALAMVHACTRAKPSAFARMGGVGRHAGSPCAGRQGSGVSTTVTGAGSVTLFWGSAAVCGPMTAKTAVRMSMWRVRIIVLGMGAARSTDSATVCQTMKGLPATSSFVRGSVRESKQQKGRGCLH